MLAISELNISADSRRLVRGVNFEIAPGEWLALAGESGSGKSLTALSIGGLLPPRLSLSGSCLWNGTELASLPASGRRRLLGSTISYIFQDYQGAFTPFLTIGKQLDEQALAHTGLNRAARKALCLAALNDVGLPGERVYRSYPFQLSGGQLQRAAIAAALMLKPGLLIADEPTTALDSVSSQMVLKLIAEAKRKHALSVLWITHDLRHVRKYADRVAVMCGGELVESGDKDRVLNAPAHSYTRRLIAAIPPLTPQPPARLGVTGQEEGAQGACRVERGSRK